jgi:maleate cis-trans isomerase
MSGQYRVGILYPGVLVDGDVELAQAEGDYPLAERLIEAPVELPVVITRVEEDVHRVDALLRTGAEEYLLEGARLLRDRGVDAAMWACTSGSFVFGLEGARAQARAVADDLGCPVSSTSLAFVEACSHLGLERVAVAGSYPPDIVALFVRFLEDAGVEVTASQSADIISGVGVGELDEARTIDLVTAADDPQAQAILVPDTAWHTIALVDRLEGAVGKPVLTANQVTIWQGLRLAGWDGSQRGLGSLFTA